jgi:chaperonin GroEL (HSP60 family)
MDKILQSPSTGEIQVTNDGATILNAIHIDNPAAKVLVNISKTQDDEVGDGTTSVCVLAAELLREAEKLINAKIHPQTIIAGTNKRLRDAARKKQHAHKCILFEREKKNVVCLNVLLLQMIGWRVALETARAALLASSVDNKADKGFLKEKRDSLPLFQELICVLIKKNVF